MFLCICTALQKNSPRAEVGFRVQINKWNENEIIILIITIDNNLFFISTVSFFTFQVTQGKRTMTARTDRITDNGTQSTTVLKQGVDRKLFFYPGFQI